MVTLGELINFLEDSIRLNGNMIVENGLGCPHSSRADYEDVSFDPEGFTDLNDMLENAKSALNETFIGWKGGNYAMDENSIVHIGFNDQIGKRVTEEDLERWV